MFVNLKKKNYTYPDLTWISRIKPVKTHTQLCVFTEIFDYFLKFEKSKILAFLKNFHFLTKYEKKIESPLLQTQVDV